MDLDAQEVVHVIEVGP
jgi:hypothetical protein